MNSVSVSVEFKNGMKNTVIANIHDKEIKPGEKIIR